MYGNKGCGNAAGTQVRKGTPAGHPKHPTQAIKVAHTQVKAPTK